MKTVGSKVASFLGLQGPDYFAIGGYQENFLGHSALSVNTCMQQTSHEPYGWLLFVWAFAIGPLFAIVCLQPVLYLSIWIKRLGREPFLWPQPARLPKLQWARHSCPQSAAVRYGVPYLPGKRAT